MKKIILGFIIVIACNACSKNNGTSVNTTQISIKNISGNYKGGTLTWLKLNSSGNNPTGGTDPNFTFSVTYLNNDMARVVITTIAPISIKTFDVPLYSKAESAYSAGYEFGSFTRQNGDNIQMRLEVDISTSGASAIIGYNYYTTNSSATEEFGGYGGKY